MGFRLRIVEGKGAGKEFVFQQPSVRIGRAPEGLATPRSPPSKIILG